MKKYLRLTCTICKRDIDKLVDITHYTPDRCTITQGCEGRLQPMEYKSSAGIAVSPEVGVQDWQPRGTTTLKTLSGNLTAPPALINLATGSLSQLVIASKKDQPTLTLSFKGVADAPKAYRSYVFRKEGAFSTISGVESGLEKKALRFTTYGQNPDMVEVYVNGVEKKLNVDFQVADGSNSSSAPPNTIVFNELIDAPGITQIDVIVSKDEASTSFSLSFKRNIADESRAGTGAYENIDYVEALEDAWVNYYLYTLDLEDANVPLNTILIPSEPVRFMLARRPYTQLDRSADVMVEFDGTDNQVDYIKYHVANNQNRFQATIDSLVTLFPPLRMHKFSVEKPISIATAGVEEQLVIDGKVITGPDA